MSMVTKAIADRTLEPSAIVGNSGDGTYPEDGSRKVTVDRCEDDEEEETKGWRSPLNALRNSTACHPRKL